MKKIITLSVLATMAITVAAQDTYTNAQMADEGLNGTARYVGMGGAMEALGADISTIGTNPAGIGLIRKSQVSFTGGLQMVGSKTIDNEEAKSTTFGLNQAGFVYSMKSGNVGNINFAFNYHKSKNFNQLFDVTNSLSNASQNKLAYNKYVDGYMQPGWSSESGVDELYDKNLMWDYDKSGQIKDYANYLNANKFRYQEMTKGYISDFDFNLSGNINNRLYLGFTATLRDVHYNNSSMYTENLIYNDDVKTGAAGSDYGVVDITDETRITGTGFSMKLGAIYRPIETSPFRIGAYIHTPTWYKLKRETRTYLNADVVAGEYSDNIANTLEYDVYTPWKFGVSMGHTLGNKFALGATYEYSKYSAMDNRIFEGTDYDYYGSYDRTSKDTEMNSNTRKSLQGVHLLKVGAEFRPISELAIRLGYNYVSPMYKKDGVRDMTLESQGVWISGTTNYTNWDATHRFTCGLGYTIGHVNIDLAYVYNTTKGTFYPFQAQQYDSSVVYDQNIPTATSVKDNRSQLSLTLGYRF